MNLADKVLYFLEVMDHRRQIRRVMRAGGGTVPFLVEAKSRALRALELSETKYHFHRFSENLDLGELVTPLGEAWVDLRTGELIVKEVEER